MIKGKLENGFEYEIEDSTINNMELVDAIAEIEENPIAISKVVKLLFNESQRKKLYDCCRRKNGKVPVEDISNAVADIFNSSKQGKN